ncbi:hypothetical protein [Rufibacter sp. LB8]|uniref:hypothetical protein n=1 Tax=Rufibacter sp. LB8 TaxID=2777781 RepID=UPI00178C41BB|nr:hypothetical protein [Rufibacter sp. LB8]
MRETNINKKEFNKNFTHYLTLPEDKRERYFGKFIYNDLLTIINNAVSRFQFNNEDEYIKDDITSELLFHFLNKKERIDKFSGNIYNALFTLFRNRILDMLRTQKVQNKRDALVTADIIRKNIANQNSNIIDEDEILI